MSSGTSWPNTLPAKDHARTACDREQSKATTRCDFRSAYGDVSLRSPRWHRCDCERSTEATYCPLNDLLTAHIAPGLEFLLAKWAAHLSFPTVAELLQDVLPLDTGLHQETVRQHVMATTDRLEAELGPEQFMYDSGCQSDIENSPEPGPPNHGGT